MLDVLFGQVLSCSFIGSYVIIAVMVARLLLKNSPKIYSYALWSVVFFRLLVPFTLESPFAILPETQFILPINQEVSIISLPKTEQQVSTSKSPEITISPSEVLNSIPNSTSILSVLWCMGMSVLVIPSLCSVVKLHKQLSISVRLERNIYLVDSIDTPFVWGLWKPKIYLPSTLNEEEKECVIPHEEYHLKRFDHITRILAFFTLILHWFNPLVWCAFVMSGRDMELSVDEKVIKNLIQESHNTALESTIKKKYATLLLELGTKKSSFVPLYVTPTFRRGETKERVKNIMKMKKTKLWVSGLTGILVSGLIVGFAFEQPETVQNNWDITDVTVTPNYGEREVVETPILTEDVSFSELLSNVIAVNCHVDMEQTYYHTYLTPEDEPWTELMNIFQKYSLSPIDYDVYPNGGGTYLSDNTLIFDHEFTVGVDTSHWTEEKCLEFDANYRNLVFTFFLDDGTALKFLLFGNLNACLTHYVINEMQGDDILDMTTFSDLPYRLTDKNVGFHSDIIFFYDAIDEAGESTRNA